MKVTPRLIEKILWNEPRTVVIRMYFVIDKILNLSYNQSYV